MTPEEWDLQRKIECACGTEWEWDRNKIALVGQWDGHGNWYEDKTESNIE
jgi:hypothetical protein